MRMWTVNSVPCEYVHKTVIPLATVVEDRMLYIPEHVGEC